LEGRHRAGRGIRRRDAKENHMAARKKAAKKKTTKKAKRKAKK
jgi:hypothetical protein